MSKVLSWLAVGLWLVPGSAQAFSIQNALRKGCHELITSNALRAVRSELPTAGALTPTKEDSDVIGDAAFDVPSDMRDLSGGALLFSVRDPDLSGNTNHELDSLTFIHGAEDKQNEHCLRRSSADEPNGTASSVAECQERILSEFHAALAGLDAQSNILTDEAHRETLRIGLGVRGEYDARLPTFHIHMGRALHATQDSFAHNLRTEDAMSVRVTTNWIDVVNDTYQEPRDGPKHLSGMDQCEDSVSPVVAQRRQVAENASASLLRVALDPAIPLEQKDAEAAKIVQGFLTIKDDGCTAANRWCDAREFSVPEPSSCICQAPGRGASPSWSGAMLGAALVATWLGRRRRRQLAAMTMAGVALGASTSAHATDEAPLAEAPKAPEPKPQSGFGAYVAGGGSVDRIATAAILGGRYRFSTTWIVGVDAEWNAFFNSGTKEFHRGVINGYGTLIRQYPLKYAEVNLRTTVNLGTSVLLSDLAQAPAGQPGLLAGLSVLGIEWRLTKGIYLVIDPIHIMLPAPQVLSPSFWYPQYRFVLGLELG